MSEEKAEMNKERALADVIRKELGSLTNRRFLSRLSAFQAEAEIPETFNALLAELDRAQGLRTR